ncbi:hypothetical protein MMC26_004418 [Xylographa opegraphella]|nr:hypothetical protein [Xylographa opegraphella]
MEPSRDIGPLRQRQPLQSLPTTPLNKRSISVMDNQTKPFSATETRPPLTECTIPLSKPRQILLQTLSPHSSLCVRTKAVDLPASADILTPPVTPIAPQSKRETSKDETEESMAAASPLDSQDATLEAKQEESVSRLIEPLSWDETTPKLFTETLSLRESYGHGAWSNVRRATASSSTSASSDPLTPPNSPPRNDMKPLPQSDSRVYAVKTPVRPSAYTVLAHEARILTYLHAVPAASTFIVPFYGFVSETHSLVLGAIPLTLDEHARAALHTARETLTTRTMFDPVIGTTQWTTFAKALISGLAFLHSRHCIHGDIKPANILLSPVSDTDFQPLICDFSSSVVLPPGSPPPSTNPANDAITPAFTAPELLEGYRPGKSVSSATFASDVFAMGVTLLVAAIGDVPYQGMALQRLTMAREGRPLAFAWAGEQGSRVMDGGVADGVLQGSLEREVGRRATATEWMRRVGG